jgi:phosphoheptose isomerase
VIDHREARIYETDVHGSVPRRITPLDLSGFGRQLHYVQDDSNGQRKPELKSFYEVVVKALHGAGSILIFGGGTGASSAMMHLVAEMKLHHADIAQRIAGEVVLDQQHLSEDQLLAAARAFYAKQAEGVVHAVPS